MKYPAEDPQYISPEMAEEPVEMGIGPDPRQTHLEQKLLLDDLMKQADQSFNMPSNMSVDDYINQIMQKYNIR